ncbi:DUF1877 family protein [Hymenobacter monticola]|uniref:YfbM family protein n=1 Tax=Hymenobacter monticola TaxID=1705399 RepID=A0ABY4BJP0_9BACT|nr:DUF1877 family protein [Hymenobacter monticola]UOE36820.1 YfbM family protein [Hymenobacter monticola]
MGQIASLFCLDEAGFQQVAANPESVAIPPLALASEGFNKTFMGLQFVLAKGRPPEQAALLGQLFEPVTHVGAEIDYDQIDWENLSADVPLEGTAVYYHDPATVQALAHVLATVTDDAFCQAFNPDELNREGVYPGGVWNREVDENIGYNARDLLEELHHLQHFFALASAGQHYCICYVG